jgi:SAM-dependent methyltransferase
VEAAAQESPQLRVGSEISKKEVVDAYDTIANRWDEAYSGPLARAENRLVFDDLIRNRGVLRGNCLDLACGTGLMLDWLSPWIAPSQYAGVDISPKMIQRAKAKWPAYDWRVLDIDQMAHKWDSRLFDSVINTFAGWSYLQQPESVARSIHDLLRPGGRVFLMPYGPGTERLHEYCIPTSQGRYISRSYWGRDEMRLLLEGAGFNDVEVYGMTSERMMEAHKNQASPVWEPAFDEMVRRDFAHQAPDRPDKFMFTIGIGTKKD